MPHTAIPKTPRSAFDAIDARVRASVLCQDEAVSAVMRGLRRFEAQLSPKRRPAASILLAGSTGTGKTLLAETLSQEFCGLPPVVIHCGEFQHSHEVAKLIGAPPGYLGHRETPAFLSHPRIRASSRADGLTFVLFDEIEKAHPAVLDLLLGVLDRATLTLGDGSTVNFESIVVLLTTNLGTREMQSARDGFGFRGAEHVEARLQAVGRHAIDANFRIELVNRLDQIVFFKTLARNDVAQILDLELERMQRRFDEHLTPFHLRVTEAARQHLLDAGYSAKYGARELRRALARLVLDPLATMMLAGQIPAEGRVVMMGEGVFALEETA